MAVILYEGEYLMRDILCDEKDCKERIDIYNEIILENREEIKKGIKRKHRNNVRMKKARYYRNFRYHLHNIIAHYCIGDPVNVMDEVFIDAVQDLEKSEDEDSGYLKLLWMVSLGILLETDK